MDTVTVGYILTALVVLGAVVLPAWRELRVRYRRRAVARDLEAFTHPLPTRRDGVGVQRRARVTQVYVVPPGQRGVRVDTDDAA